MGSSVVPVKQALLALMQAATWPTRNPEFRWGGPTEGEDEPPAGELIYFFDVRGLEDEQIMLGVENTDEDYNLRIHIDVRLDGDDEQATETRAWELFAALRSLLRANRALIESPNDLIVRLEGRSVDQRNYSLPQAWLSRIIVDQHVAARVFNP